MIKSENGKIIIFVEDAEGDSVEVELPTKWEVCGTCDGAGKSSAYLGAFTQSEWAEQDEDFRMDYVAGRYDRPCDECKGRTTVLVVDEDKLTPKLKEEYEHACKEEADYRSICEAERRMGA